MKQISIVIPAYNEQHNIPVLFAELERLFHTSLSSYSHELIFINDGSADTTWLTILELTQQHPHVKGINFSRNFGHQIALTAGYDYATGDAVISMDAACKTHRH